MHTSAHRIFASAGSQSKLSQTPSHITTTEYCQTPKMTTEYFDFPTEIITEVEGNIPPEFIDIPMETFNIRGRSHLYPEDKGYINTTHYDSKTKTLDIGYQKLRQLNISKYPDFCNLTQLFIDHNELITLPDPEHLPNLQYLTCAANKLETIPFYPNLRFLNIAENRILSCPQYSESNIEYFDCSHNKGFDLNLRLPQCYHLYAEYIDLEQLDLGYFPSLQFLDCSNNRLPKIQGDAPNLVELAVSRNDLERIPPYLNLRAIIADYNKIIEIITYPELDSLTVDHNLITSIASQPNLTKLFASNNNIQQIGIVPKLEIVDIGWNHLRSFILPSNVEYATLYFNPIKELELSPLLLNNIKELRINYPTYRYLYDKYRVNIQAIDTQTNSDRLEILMNRMEKQLNISTSITKYIYRQFKNLKFPERERDLDRIALSIYKKVFGVSSQISKVFENNNYIKLRRDIENLYYNALMVTLYFNGYYN